MRVLHCLSQRPSLTGSGVTLDALVNAADASGWTQAVVAGVPADAPAPGSWSPAAALFRPLCFDTLELPFPVPGMSDVMPYQSTVFSTMSRKHLGRYETAWRHHLTEVIREFRPDVIHSHHVWIMSALVNELAGEIPVVTHCHATGLRQLALAPESADRVRRGCRRSTAFAVLHQGHAVDLGSALAVPLSRIHTVGAGYRDDLFHRCGRTADGPPDLLYIGKFSAAKGLPWLLDAFERLVTERPDITLHVAGSGSGAEADALRERMESLAPRVHLHGQLAQSELAGLMRRATVAVLPSFFEGLPLVLVEALASGCRLVATDLPGVVDELAPRLGSALHVVERPPMIGVDTPDPTGLPDFVDRLEHELRLSLEADAPTDHRAALQPFTWRAVFQRVEDIWRRVTS